MVLIWNKVRANSRFSAGVFSVWGPGAPLALALGLDLAFALPSATGARATFNRLSKLGAGAEDASVNAKGAVVGAWLWPSSSPAKESGVVQTAAWDTIEISIFSLSV